MREFVIEKSKNVRIPVKIDTKENLSSLLTDYALCKETKKLDTSYLKKLKDGKEALQGGITYLVSLEGTEFKEFLALLDAAEEKISWILMPEGIKEMVLNGVFPYFNYPVGIYIDTDHLFAIDNEEFYLMIAYTMGLGIANNVNLYSYLINSLYELCELNKETLEELFEMIYRLHGKLMIKKTKEERKLMPIQAYLCNFFLTVSDFKEADAVAYGCIMGAYYSYTEGKISTEEYYEVRDMFVPFGISIMQSKYNKPTLFRMYRAYMEEHPVEAIAPLKKIGRLDLPGYGLETKINEEHFEAVYFDELAND